MLQIKIYAPVIIPTLCRFEHFKRCVESLARCTGADRTELFIGLDYPANDSHWTGYNKINEYVDSIVGFKKVYIFRRGENYGVKRNILDLRKKVREKYDRYISTEDDNEVSPNFLEYMNKGLELYKDNPQVLAICAYSYPFDYCSNISGYSYNAYPMRSFCGWGIGYWVEKWDKTLSPFINQENAYKLIHSWRLVYKLFQKKLHITVHRLLFRHKTSYADLMWHSYCVLYDAYCIFPRLSKVRNHGFDGNGLNCAVNPIYAKQEIDKSVSFDFDDIKIESYEPISIMHDRLYGGTWCIRRLCEIEYMMFRIFGISFRNRVSRNGILKVCRRNSNKT